MVRCNLSVLLAERNLKITKVCKDTGISRTTLTYLANNYSKGIQYDTLNTLCTYLQVTPGELISFIPVDIFIAYVHRTDHELLEIEMEITINGTTKKCGLSGNAFLSFPSEDDPDIKNRSKPHSVDIYVGLWLPLNIPDKELEEENKFIISAFKQIPITFLKDLETEITNEVINDLDYEYHLESLSEPIACSFTWDPSLRKQ